MTNFNYSFEQWCIDNNRQDLIDRWDTEANGVSCSEISFKSNKKYFFKCPDGKHKSTAYTLYDIAAGKNKEVKCKGCYSFAQAITSKYGKRCLNKIWSKQNTVNPWEVSAFSSIKCYFVCDKNPSHIFADSLNHYSNGIGCPYCSNHRIVKENSLGTKFSESINVWSEKNEKTPFDYSPSSGVSVWWKCENGIHEDFQRKICNSNIRHFKCPQCSRLESYSKRRSNLTNMRFGELFVIGYDQELSLRRKRPYWKCECSCGKIISTSASNLLTGDATTCGDRTVHYSGDNNGNWKGGVTPELLKERTSSKYNKWRDEVYKKDWYTCQCCGKSHKIIKHAHHLQNFSENKKLRYDVKNGILLCEECHSAVIEGGFHYIYGTINNTPEQLEEYIKERRKQLGIDIPFSIKSYLKGEILKPRKD